MINIKEMISLEIENIEELFKVSYPLISLSKVKELDVIETMASATFLHSFYNGIEKIFLIVNKEFDTDKIMDSDAWHKELLEKVRKKTGNRSFVISEETKNKLYDYLGFRHFFRHSYSFQLKWKYMGKLMIPIEEVWKNLKIELQEFISTL